MGTKRLHSWGQRGYISRDKEVTFMGTNLGYIPEDKEVIFLTTKRLHF